MADGVKQYRRALKRKLRCSGGVRKRLLEKFDGAAVSYLENEPTPALAGVTEAFGPPEEMARTLMEEVTSEEATAYKWGVIVRRVIAAVALAAVLGFAIYTFCWKEVGFTIIVETYEILPDGTKVPVNATYTGSYPVKEK